MIHAEKLQSYASILRHCANEKALTKGRDVHLQLIAAGFSNDTLIGNLLVQMYRSCESLEEAWKAFDNICQRNEISWNIMLAAYAQDGSLQEAKSMFDLMPLRTVVTWNSMLAACGQKGLVEDAKKLFDEMPETTAVSWGAMMGAYTQNGHLHEARNIFDNTPQPTVVSWNSMIVAYAQGGHLLEARSLFDRMPEQDVISWTAMMTAYAQNGHLHAARMLFNGIPQKNVVSWNAMISAYAQSEQGREALQLFQAMDLNGVQPNKITLVSALDACASLGIHEGKILHAIIESTEFWSDVEVGSACIHMYAKCGSLDNARTLFDKMPLRDVFSWTTVITAYTQKGQVLEARNFFEVMPQRNVVSWNTMITGYAQSGHLRDAQELFNRIPHPDVVSCNVMIAAYAQGGHFHVARSMFDRISESDLVSWNCMIAAYAQNGHSKEALELYRLMDVEGVKPSIVTFVSVIDACAGITALSEGKAIHARVTNHGLELEGPLGNALVNMYGKCGHLEDARHIFDRMMQPTVVSWTGMIAAYAQNGESKKALELFRNMAMEGMQPNSITFVCILSACSQAGVLSEGLRYFLCMKGDHGIEPSVDHYVCLIDLFGRMGQLENAEDLINNMPCESDPVAWKTLLAASRIHGDMQRGARAGEQAMKLQKEADDDSAAYVLLSNIYADESR